MDFDREFFPTFLKVTVQSAGKTLFNVTMRKIGYERNCLTLEEKKGSEGVESDQFKTIPGQLKDQPCHVVDDPLKRKGHESGANQCTSRLC